MGWTAWCVCVFVSSLEPGDRWLIPQCHSCSTDVKNNPPLTIQWYLTSRAGQHRFWYTPCKQKACYQCAFDKLGQSRLENWTHLWGSSPRALFTRSEVLYSMQGSYTGPTHSICCTSHFSVNKDTHSIFHIVIHSQEENKNKEFLFCAF